jgi:polyhydroxyalkanoate synthase
MAESRRSDTPFRDEAAQQALNAVLGANPFVRLDPTELLATAGRVGLAAARPGLLARHARHLGRELAAIAAGRSEVRPGRGDRRFSDTAWTEMPLYRGLMQGYLAASSEVQHLIDDVPVDDRERARARFLATIATEALAPTNLLAGNPAALKRTLETGGANLARGVRHWIGDLLHNGGMPRQVDTRHFVLGKTVAVSPGSVVYRNDQLELVQYRPTTERVRARPIVIIPPQINKFWVFDLAPGRSMVEHATSKGLQVFAS